MKIIDYLKTDHRWGRIKSIVFPTVINSMYEIIKQNKENRKSLGVFKPANVDFCWKRSRKINVEQIKSYYSQLSFSDRKKLPLSISL